MKFVILCALLGFVSLSQGAVQVDLKGQLAADVAKIVKFVQDQLNDPKSDLSKLAVEANKVIAWWGGLKEAERQKIINDAKTAVKGAWDWLVKEADNLNKQLADPNSEVSKALHALWDQVQKWFTSPEAKAIFDGAKKQIDTFLASPAGQQLLVEGGKLLKQGTDFFSSPEGQKVIAEATKALGSLAG